MNFTQNDKLNQVTEDTLVVGIDIAKYKHVARAIDNRGHVLTKPFCFQIHKKDFSHFFNGPRNFSTHTRSALDVVGNFRNKV